MEEDFNIRKLYHLYQIGRLSAKQTWCPRHSRYIDRNAWPIEDHLDPLPGRYFRHHFGSSTTGNLHRPHQATAATRCLRLHPFSPDPF
ncbi:MAG: hypothetical protein HN348_21825 [Proteobacteria bacterium]|nr:hypothetical protein [Pseudomonadota bacterium]